MNILIADDEPDILEILSFTFESEADVVCTCVSSGNEAIKSLRSKEEFDLIVSDFNMPDGNGAALYEYLLENKIKIPFALCSSILMGSESVFSKGDIYLGQIEKPYIYDGVVSILESYDKIKDDYTTNLCTVDRNKSEYAHVGLNLLKTIDETPADLFLSLTEDKFLKVVNANDTITSEDITKYELKNILGLFINKTKVQPFIEELMGSVSKILEDRDIEDGEKVRSSINIILNTVKSLGFSSSVIKATEQSVKFAISTFEKKSDLMDFYKKLFKNPDSYLTKHSIALSYLCCGILKETKWDSPEVRNKLVMASFLHDSEFHNLLLDERRIDLTPIDKEKFDKHSYEAAQKIKVQSGIPSDVDVIINDHHERPDGSGFPKGLSAKSIKPIPSLFILCHEIVNIILDLQDHNQEFSHIKINEKNDRELFSNGSFSKLLEAYDKVRLFDE